MMSSIRLRSIEEFGYISFFVFVSSQTKHFKWETICSFTTCSYFPHKYHKTHTLFAFYQINVCLAHAQGVYQVSIINLFNSIIKIGYKIVISFKLNQNPISFWISKKKLSTKPQMTKMHSYDSSVPSINSMWWGLLTWGSLKYPKYYLSNCQCLFLKLLNEIPMKNRLRIVSNI